MFIYIYIYIYTHTHTYMYMYIYIYIYNFQMLVAHKKLWKHKASFIPASGTWPHLPEFKLCICQWEQTFKNTSTVNFLSLQVLLCLWNSNINKDPQRQEYPAQLTRIHNVLVCGKDVSASSLSPQQWDKDKIIAQIKYTQKYHKPNQLAN